MTSGVYRIRNLLNGKCYFGSAGARGIQRRLGEHRALLERGEHHSPHLQRAWGKYGPEQFVFELVEECRPEQCLEREQHYLDTVLFASCPDDRFHKLGYNISRSAQAVMTGRRHTEETRRKISRSKRGQCRGEDHPFYGKRHTRQAIEKNRKAHTKLTPHQILEIKELLAGSDMTQEQIARQFGVHQSTISLINRGKVWPDAGVPTGGYIYGSL